MKRYIHKVARYTALILISSMPFSLEVNANTEKELSLILKIADADNDLLTAKRKDFMEKE